VAGCIWVGRAVAKVGNCRSLAEGGIRTISPRSCQGGSVNAGEII